MVSLDYALVTTTDFDFVPPTCARRRSKAKMADFIGFRTLFRVGRSLLFLLPAEGNWERSAGFPL